MADHASLIKSGGRVLDLACGGGRHAVWLAQQGYQVDALDRDALVLAGLYDISNIHVLIAYLEANDAYAFNHRYDGVIVSRYLYRPLLKTLAAILNPNGVLIYETFMLGNARFGKPNNPNFLLLPIELLEVYSPLLKVVAFEQGEVIQPKPAVIQCICAVNAPSIPIT